MISTIPPCPVRLRIAVLVNGSALLVGAIGCILTIAIASATRAGASREVTTNEIFTTVDVRSEVTDVITEYADVNASVLTFAHNDDQRNLSLDGEVDINGDVGDLPLEGSASYGHLETSIGDNTVRN